MGCRRPPPAGAAGHPGLGRQALRPDPRDAAREVSSAPPFSVSFAGAAGDPRRHSGGRGRTHATLQTARGVQPSLQLQPVHHRRRQPARARRLARRRRAPRPGLQPAVPARPAGPRQDPPPPRDRELRARVRRWRDGPLHDRRGVHQPLHHARSRSRSLEHFKHAYRDADVLLIDDVQFLASKAKTEEEFFHTFNALYETGRQLVLTCDRLPRQLVTVEERLRERFESGLVADIRPPDFATRVAILRKRAAARRRPCSPTTTSSTSSPSASPTTSGHSRARLIRIVAHHSLTGRPIDVELATRSARRHVPAARTRRPSRSRTSRRPSPATTTSPSPSSSPPVAPPGSPGRVRSRSISRGSSPTTRCTDRRRLRPQPRHRPPRVQTRLRTHGRRSTSRRRHRRAHRPHRRRQSRPRLLTHLPVLLERQLHRSLRTNAHLSTASIRPMTSTFLLRYSS